MSPILLMPRAARCAGCRGRGFVPYRTRDGRTVRVPCACMEPVPAVDDYAPLFTGATALPLPRPWPLHLSKRADENGAPYIHCDRGCPARYLTPPGQSPAAQPPADEAWAIAMAHRCEPRPCDPEVTV